MEIFYGCEVRIPEADISSEMGTTEYAFQIVKALQLTARLTRPFFEDEIHCYITCADLHGSGHTWLGSSCSQHIDLCSGTTVIAQFMERFGCDHIHFSKTDHEKVVEST